MPINPIAVEPRFRVLGFLLCGIFACYGAYYVITQTYLSCGIAPPMAVSQSLEWGEYPDLWFCAVPQSNAENPDFTPVLETLNVNLQTNTEMDVRVKNSTKPLSSLTEKGRGFGYTGQFDKDFKVRVNNADFASIACRYFETSSLGGLDPAIHKETVVTITGKAPAYQGGKFILLAESIAEDFLPWMSVLAETSSVHGNAWMPQQVVVHKEITEIRGFYPWDVTQSESFRTELAFSLPPLEVPEDGQSRLFRIRLLAFYNPVQITTTSNVIWTLFDVISSFGGQATILTVIWSAIFVLKYRESARLTLRGRTVKGTLVQQTEIGDEEEEESDTASQKEDYESYSSASAVNSPAPSNSPPAQSGYPFVTNPAAHGYPLRFPAASPKTPFAHEVI